MVPMTDDDLAHVEKIIKERDRLRRINADLLAACIVAHTRMMQAYAVRVRLTGIASGAMKNEIDKIAAAIAEATKPTKSGE